MAERVESDAGFVIRAAEPCDAEGLARLANLPGYRHHTLRLPFESVETTRHRLFERRGPGLTLLVACLDDEIVGSGSVNRLSGRRSHVGQIGMGVHDDHRRRGIGRGLLDALIDLSDNWLGLVRLELDVMVDNAGAIALYEAAGFEVEGRLRAAALR